MLFITNHYIIDDDDITISFIRSSGPGGQNVNKVSTAVLLRYNLSNAKNLPDDLKARLLTKLANKITLNGDIIVKAERFRSQGKNKQDALERLQQLLQEGTIIQKKRRKSKPSYSSTQKRLDTKKLHSKNKSLRSKPNRDS